MITHFEENLKNFNNKQVSLHIPNIIKTKQYAQKKIIYYDKVITELMMNQFLHKLVFFLEIKTISKSMNERSNIAGDPYTYYCFD